MDGNVTFDANHEAIMEGSTRRRGLVWPILLMGAGVIFLLNNLGIVSWNVWSGLWQLWPVLLIAVGLDILIGRRSVLGSLLVVLVTVGLLVVLALNLGPQVQLQSQLHTVAVSQGLEGARDADIDIEPGAANLHLSEAAESSGLVQGSVALAGAERAVTRFWRTGDTAHFQLHAQDSQYAGGLNLGQNEKSWDLQLNPDVPLRLQVNSGVGNATLDLSHLNVSRLAMDGSVGSTTVMLPRRGQISVTLDGGVGQVRMILPPGVAARMQVNGGLGGIDVNGRFQHRGNEYTSPDYDTAENRADIQINAGVGRVSLEQGEGG